ncbi:MAG TPA: chemotaxis protein CheD [Geobacteraceae bacterium]|nr:chemotaxis protein CheD [Geobacteraceae bacterium]
MNNPDDTLERVYLKPGECHFSVRPSVVSTVLGSCISVTMFNPERRIGAICHAILPEEKTPGEAFRFVDSSIMVMLKSFERHGIHRSGIEIKLFGGSDVLPTDNGRERGNTVGKQNIGIALQVVEKEGLRLVTTDLGGTRGRKIVFHTHTGEIFLKRLRKIMRSSRHE